VPHSPRAHKAVVVSSSPPVKGPLSRNTASYPARMEKLRQKRTVLPVEPDKQLDFQAGLPSADLLGQKRFGLGRHRYATEKSIY
jgi:hypothetical protein